MDTEIREIARKTRDSWEGKNLVAIVEDGGLFQVHQHSAEGVAPMSGYLTARQAVARVLQLFKLGPVAPQTWPEEVCISSVSLEEQEERS